MAVTREPHQPRAPGAATIRASAFIICRDEEANIGACIASVGDFADIVVVDSGSTDGTLAIVQEMMADGYPVRLFEREWPGYGAQKQFALEQCREEWRLNIDADERLDQALAGAIGKIVAGDTPHAAFAVRRSEWITGYGHAHPLVAPDWIVRLARRGRSKYDPAGIIHESLLIDGSIGRIREGWLLHFNRTSIERRLEKIDRYSTLRASNRVAAGRRQIRMKLLFGPLMHFFKLYVLKRYFLCGWAGFIHAALDAQYSLDAEAKHWLHEQGGHDG